jgi:hypothetical protein
MYDLNGPPPLKLCQGQLDPIPVGWRRVSFIVPDDLVIFTQLWDGMKADRISDPD